MSGKPRRRFVAAHRSRAATLEAGGLPRLLEIGRLEERVERNVRDPTRVETVPLRAVVGRAGEGATGANSWNACSAEVAEVMPPAEAPVMIGTRHRVCGPSHPGELFAAS